MIEGMKFFWEGRGDGEQCYPNDLCSASAWNLFFHEYLLSNKFQESWLSLSGLFWPLCYPLFFSFISNVQTFLLFWTYYSLSKWHCPNLPRFSTGNNVIHSKFVFLIVKLASLSKSFFSTWTSLFTLEPLYWWLYVGLFIYKFN